LAALKDLIEGKYSTVEQILLLISYAVIVYLAVEIPIVLKIFWPARVEKVVEAANTWVMAHVRLIAGGIAGILGIWQLVAGITNLN
jgi:Sap, sulfolipid-1-addressing protein